MSTIKSIIQEICPQAVFQETENAPLHVSLQAADLAKLLKPLREDAALQFDYLEDLVGMDFGEKLGVIYRLYSTVHNHRIIIECQAESRQEPELPTLSHIWAIANFYEREVFDFFGIHFIVRRSLSSAPGPPPPA